MCAWHARWVSAHHAAHAEAVGQLADVIFLLLSWDPGNKLNFVFLPVEPVPCPTLSNNFNFLDNNHF